MTALRLHAPNWNNLTYLYPCDSPKLTDWIQGCIYNLYPYTCKLTVSKLSYSVLDKSMWQLRDYGLQTVLFWPSYIHVTALILQASNCFTLTYLYLCDNPEIICSKLSYSDLAIFMWQPWDSGLHTFNFFRYLIWNFPWKCINFMCMNSRQNSKMLICLEKCG